MNSSRLLPQNGISFAFFNGTEIDDELLDKKVIEGTLGVQVDTLSVLLKNYLPIEKLPFGVSFAVNPVIVKFMENLRYIDKTCRIVSI